MLYLSKKPRALKKQSGVVIIVALFIVVLVTMMTTYMMSRLAKDTHRQLLFNRYLQSSFYAEGSVAWAQDQLKRNFDEKRANRVVDNIPYRVEAEVNGFHIVSTLIDLQSRMNLNNLTLLPYQEIFKRLLIFVDPSLSEAKAKKIIEAIMDWITPDTSVENEFSQYYSHLPKPYRSAHRLMADSSELKLIKGITPTLYDKLKPFIVALPQTKLSINFQTATIPILFSLSPKMTLDAANAFVKLRANLPIVSIDIFNHLEIMRDKKVPSDQITAESNYFLLKTEVQIEKQQLILYTVLERLQDKNKSIINILSQSKGFD